MHRFRSTYPGRQDWPSCAHSDTSSQKTIPSIPKKRGWRFRTKLELAARLVEWIATLVKNVGKTFWVAVYHLNLWMHTLVELWAWNRGQQELCNRRASPWEDPERRPSHADRRKALRRHILRNELSAITAVWSLPRKILTLAQRLMALAA